MQRKIISWCITFVFGAAALLLFFVNALLIWLVTGPRSLNQLTPYIERSLTSDGAYSVKIQDTQLVWDGWQNPIDVRARNMRILTAEGTVFATFPEVSVGFSIAQLALGRLMPRTLIIKNPDINLFQAENGNILFGFANEAPERALALQQIIGGLAHGDDDTQSNHIHHIIIRDANVSMSNKTSGVFLTAPRTQVFITRTSEGYRGSFDLPLHYEQKISSVSAEFSLTRASRQLQAGLNFSQFDPKMLARLSDAFASLKAVDMLATGKANVYTNTDTGNTTADFLFKTSRGQLSDAEHFAEPVAIDSCDVKGRMRTEPQTLTLESAQCALKEITVSASGEFVKTDAGNNIKLQGRVAHMPVESLYRYWPLTASPVARRWVTTNITKGNVPEADINLNITPKDFAQPALPENVMAATIRVENANVKYLEGHPPLEHVNGVVKFSGKGMKIDVASGSMLSGSVLNKASLDVADLWPEYPHMQLDMDITAPVQDVVQYLDLPDLNYSKPLALNYKTVSGQAAGHMKMDFYMLGNDKPSKIPDQYEIIAMDADVKVTNGAAVKFLNKYDLTNVNANIAIKNRQATLKGDLIANTVPARVEVMHDFTGKATADNVYHIETSLLSAQAPLFGYPDFAFLKGKIGLKVDAVEKGPDIATKVLLDLTQTGINFSDMGYIKNIGQPLNANLDLSETAGSNIHINNFAFKGTNLAAKGSATVGVDKKSLSTLTFDSLIFGKNDLAMNYNKTDGMETVSVKGASIDLSPRFKSQKSYSRQDIANISLTTDMQKVILGPNTEIYKLHGDLTCDARYCMHADISGQTKDDHPFSYSIVNKGGKRILAVSAEDAGELIRALNISENLNGGKMEITGEFNDGEVGNPLVGKLIIVDYELYKAPVLTKLLTLSSLTGILDTLSGKGISFARLVAPFNYKGDVITLKGAKTHGSSLGITADGTINAKTANLDIEGTIVPAYALNTIVGNIPLVGQVLAGGKGQGIFAANYKVKGPYKDPEVRLNPLSILTPGFLRGLFDIFDRDKEATSEDVAPEKAAPASAK